MWRVSGITILAASPGRGPERLGPPGPGRFPEAEPLIGSWPGNRRKDHRPPKNSIPPAPPDTKTSFPASSFSLLGAEQSASPVFNPGLCLNIWLIYLRFPEADKTIN